MRLESMEIWDVMEAPKVGNGDLIMNFLRPFMNFNVNIMPAIIDLRLEDEVGIIPEETSNSVFLVYIPLGAGAYTADQAKSIKTDLKSKGWTIGDATCSDRIIATNYVGCNNDIDLKVIVDNTGKVIIDWISE